jgi:hypothetical protein
LRIIIEEEIEIFGSWSSILRISGKLSLRYRMCNIGKTLFIEKRYCGSMNGISRANE